MDFVEEGGRRNLRFVLGSRRGEGQPADQRFGRRQGMEDHHSRLRRQMAEEMGRQVAPAAPLLPPTGDTVPWHHRAGPIGGGLNVADMEAAEARRAAERAAMPRIIMPGEAIPHY